MDQFSRYRNETWNIETPQNAEIVKVLLYFNYNWDTSFFPNGWKLTFNEREITGNYISHEIDRGNLGQWGAYNYGLLIFDVTDYYNVNGENSFVINKTLNCALYPSTLYVLYNVTDSTNGTDVYFSDIVDVFYPLYNGNRYDDLLKFSVNFNNVDLTNIQEATWYVFSGSSSLNNNLSFNGGIAVNPFEGYSPNDCRPYAFNVTNLISKDNEAWFISSNQASTTVAYEQVLVVKKKVKTSIEFDFDNLDLEIGSSVTVHPIVKPETAGVTYKSNDTTVATIDGNGKITAIKYGKALITATVGDGIDYPFNYTDFTVNVNKKQSFMNLAVSFDETSQNYIVNVGLPNGTSGSVCVDVDNKKFYGDIQEGSANVIVSGLDAGNYTADVNYPGDSNYDSISKNLSTIF